MRRAGNGTVGSNPTLSAIPRRSHSGRRGWLIGWIGEARQVWAVESVPSFRSAPQASNERPAAMKWFCPAPFQEGALASALGGKRPFVLSPLKFDYFSYSTSEDVHLEWLGYYEHAVVEAAFSDNGILCISRNE